MEIVMDKIRAVIVAIEDYQFSTGRNKLNNVDYARNDALAFKDLLVEAFDVDEENIITRLDGDATKSWLENELPYEIRNLENDEKFIFYYAGHGFFQDGTNRLTAWDSHPFNLQDTTVSLKEVLLDPIEEADCDRSLIFIDACARELPKIVKTRDLISTMNKAEFEEFVKGTSYRAIFTSCSPGQISYPSHILKHGIWTWHLIEALSGRAELAITRDKYITDASLRDYLRHEIPRYIRKNTDIRGKQIPYAIISSSGTFQIRRLPEDEEAEGFPKLELKYAEAYLRKIETEDISGLNGFDKKKGHFVPQDVNTYANSFVKNLLDDDIREELKEIYDSAKRILELKRKDIEKSPGDGGGMVETEFFRYYLNVEQNPDDCTEALITRRLIIRVKISELPDNFDDIFPTNLDEIVVPISGSLDFDDIVEAFENLEESIGGNLEEDEDSGMIEYITSDKQIHIMIQAFEKNLVIHPKGSRGCLDLIEKANIGLKQITGGARKLLK